jgi:alanyl-tRNA synthetase
VTHRLYYTDAYTLTFDARVRGMDTTGTRVVLDRTAFYPTSGGQPFDTGVLGSRRVVDVIEDDAGEIVHLLDAPIAVEVGAALSGTVDAARRRDHREQHTAQHLLSALCADQFGWNTVSVHFGSDRSLIELDTERITSEQLRTLERAVDDAARRPLAVSVGFEDAGAALGLRKPTARDGEIRVVTIDGVDRSACGGTHVRSTVELLPIALIGMERMRGQMRIAFVAGQRAVARAAADASLVARLAQSLTCAPNELETTVDQLRTRAEALDAERRQLRGALAVLDARALYDGAPIGADGIRRVRVTRDGEPLEAQKPLVQALVALGGVIVCVTSTSPIGVLLAASSDVSLDCGRTLREAITTHGGRGGGNVAQAQGTVPSIEALAAVCTTIGFA